ncbi:MAG: 1-phosphofructokinase [Lachnospiraceae bacterium]|nr:1-phosphofructokinase [Lachnospiraceae bacterium]
MLYTVTFNPSLDYIVGVENFRLGRTNRTAEELILPGGKGINVSIVLKNLGFETTALGFTAGFVGEEIKRRVEELGIISHFIDVEEGVSRINVKLKSIEGTEINGMGPKISEEKVEQLMQQLETLTSEDCLFLSGSIPPSMPDDMYSRIMKRFQDKGCRIVVDAAKDLLLNVLAYHPFLIKPNNHELEEIFGVELNTRESVIEYGRKLQQMGAVNVLISMAGDGAVLIAEDGEVYSSPAPEGTVVNAVGAGDSMAAGFMAGFLSSGEYKKAFYMGIACGSASAFSDYLATEEEVLEVLQSLQY